MGGDGKRAKNIGKQIKNKKYQVGKSRRDYQGCWKEYQVGEEGKRADNFGKQNR